ncbi:hypothetical protein BGZ96_011407 [Linnemannia gamsii]|uniref:Uncharacterized protein n=1 Tax=Linnemannia gamsii TaxID=64522 RepID=A0ABQ7KI56_9FUNG|nr:hypothetical protein BGZ96_011407 [Linnemannia gamsii]
MPAAILERRSKPKADTTPSIIGTIHAPRAVALGTTNDSIAVTNTVPIIIRWVLEPILDNVTSAMRLSNPVDVMPAEINSAAATSAKARSEKPAKAIERAPAVP